MDSHEKRSPSEEIGGKFRSVQAELLPPFRRLLGLAPGLVQLTDHRRRPRAGLGLPGEEYWPGAPSCPRSRRARAARPRRTSSGQARLPPSRLRALNVDQSSGWAFSRIVRHSRSTGSASANLSCLRRFMPSGAMARRCGGRSGPTVFRACSRSSRSSGSALGGPAERPRRPTGGCDGLTSQRVGVSGPQLCRPVAFNVDLCCAIASVRPAGGHMYAQAGLRLVSVSGWSGPSFDSHSFSVASCSAMASAVAAGRPGRPAARLLRLASVSGWSGPSFASRSFSVASSSAIASAVRPAAGRPRRGCCGW